MKYMILTFASQRDYDALAGRPGPEAVWSPGDFAALGDFMAGFNSELEEAGELVETRGLAAPVHTRRMHSHQGALVVTEGPYAETEEVLAGYWVVECDTLDRAVAIAARLVEAPAPAGVAARAYADVRPIAESQAELAVEFDSQA